MTRGTRRTDGGPEHPLEQVRTLARLSSIQLTQKARDEAAALLPPSVGLPSVAVRNTLLALHEDHWKFAEENERGWVDVYRILRHNRLIWAKLKVEMRNAREMVVLLSFHDYDDDIPI
jgi:Motility quorum-sensing regulator, toxin of MqsA